ncbi:hypothetical protein [Winogradskyella poriferorum]|uniref:hypothetical protein n=1 Tax=Winogradskyella poriferorum TaxID=307627 RepID=UPI003D656B6B
MTSIIQKPIKKLVITFVLVLLLGFFANWFLTYKIKETLSNLPPYIELTYDDLIINVLMGNVVLEGPRLKLKPSNSNLLDLDAKGTKAEVIDFGYFTFLTKKKVHIEQIELKDFTINYIKGKAQSKKQDSIKQTNGHRNGFEIDKITLKNSIVSIKTDSIEEVLGLKIIKLDALGIQTNQAENSINSINLNDVQGQIKDLKYQTNPYDHLIIGDLELNNNQALISDLQLKTKYSRADLSRILKSERDHFDISVDSVVLDKISFGFDSNNRFFFGSENTNIQNPNLVMFRDKLVNDSYANKPLYAKMLRDLNINLSLDTLSINNGQLSYEEKVKSTNKGGRLNFQNLNTTVYRLGNTYENDTTHIHIESDFMDKSPIAVDWKFVVQDPEDKFSFQGELAHFRVGEISKFTQPNLNVEFQGELKETYFNINGNSYHSDIDLQVNFENFRVVVLRKDGKGKNKFFSGLVNMIVSTNSGKDTNAYYYGNINRIERDRTKSIFNFIWKNIEAGLVSAMTGSGKKKN